MTRVWFGVQAHPSRANMAAALAEQMRGEAVFDPRPNDRPSAWRTYRAALERALAKNVTHACIVQDDATLCRNFSRTVRAAVRARPNRLIALYVAGMPREHTHAVMMAAARGEPWARLKNDRWFPVVAAVWPVTLIPPLLAYVDAQNWPAEFRADDEIVGRFLRAEGRDALATVPSLVEHADLVPSLLGRRARGGEDRSRTAACWVGTECDPSGTDWTPGPE